MGYPGIEQVPDEALLVIFAGLSPRALLACEGAAASCACTSPAALQNYWQGFTCREEAMLSCLS